MGYPILIMNHWKKGRNYRIHFGPHVTEKCFTRIAYFPMYYVYVNDVSISHGDKSYDLELFSSNKSEFDDGRPSPPDDSVQYQKDYLFYQKNPEIYDVSRVAEMR